MSDATDLYIQSTMHQIDGWLYEEDAYALVAVDAMQQALEARGALVEIGAYRGKTLALLALLATPDETVIGIDGFRLGRSSAEACRQALELATGDRDRAELWTYDTQRDAVRERPYTRLLHIDGGHEYGEVMSDLQTFSPDMTDKGVIVMDDYFQRDDHGVAVAVCDFTRSNSFVPFMSSFNKLFLCRGHTLGYYVASVLSDPAYVTNSRVVYVRGRPMVITKSKKPMSLEACLKRIGGPA